MSKCSVLRTLKSKCSHWTLFRPKYRACADPATKTRRREERRRLRTLHLMESDLPERSGNRLQVRCRARMVAPGGVAERFQRLLVQKLVRVRPRPRPDPVHDPGHAHRLEVARAVDAADVDDAPAERVADLADDLLRVVVVAAEEHVGRAAGEVRLIEQAVADGVEGLYEPRARNLALHLLAEGVVEADGEPRRARAEVERVRGVDDDLPVEVLRPGQPQRFAPGLAAGGGGGEAGGEPRRARAEVERVRGVDDDLPVEVLRPGQPQRFARGLAEGGEGDEIAELRRLLERAAAHALRARGEVAELLRRARADHDVVPDRRERAPERLPDVPRAEDSDVHFAHGPGVYSALGGSVCTKPSAASAHPGRKRRQSLVMNAARRPKIAHDSKSARRAVKMRSEE